MSDMSTTSIRTLQHEMAAILERVGGGEEIVLTRHNKPIAKLVPFPVPPTKKRRSKSQIRKFWLDYQPKVELKSTVSHVELVSQGRDRSHQS